MNGKCNGNNKRERESDRWNYNYSNMKDYFTFKTMAFLQRKVCALCIQILFRWLNECHKQNQLELEEIENERYRMKMSIPTNWEDKGKKEHSTSEKPKSTAHTPK